MLHDRILVLIASVTRRAIADYRRWNVPPPALFDEDDLCSVAIFGVHRGLMISRRLIDSLEGRDAALELAELAHIARLALGALATGPHQPAPVVNPPDVVEAAFNTEPKANCSSGRPDWALQGYTEVVAAMVVRRAWQSRPRLRRTNPDGTTSRKPPGFSSLDERFFAADDTRDSTDTRIDLETALERFPTRDREILRRRLIEGMTFKELSEIPWPSAGVAGDDVQLTIKQIWTICSKRLDDLVDGMGRGYRPPR